jgi:hypothetical protein
MQLMAGKNQLIHYQLRGTVAISLINICNSPYLPEGHPHQCHQERCRSDQEILESHYSRPSDPTSHLAYSVYIYAKVL